MKINKKIKTIIILLIICIFIVFIPILTIKNSEFRGSDDAGADTILEFEEKDIELLFRLQATLGLLEISYCFVKLRKRNFKK